ncbi:MAG: RIP metalloprotease RseP, partial [Brasilonema sp.]
MSVLAVIAVLALLIVVHELGHFAAARFQGIRVNRFSLGFGPILLKHQGPETEYAIRAFPLGGYVGFPDDDPDSEIPPNDPNLLRNRPILDRAIVISAGVIANLIFAYFLLVGQATTIGIQNFQPGVTIPQVFADAKSVAFQAGIKPGDIILAINDQKLPASPEAISLLRETIQKSANKPLQLTTQRGQETRILAVTPEPGDEGKGKIGVMLAPNIGLHRANNIIAAFTLGADE